MTWPITLHTDRLTLRPWNELDAEALYTYASDPAIGAAAGWLPHSSVEESRRVIKEVLCAPNTFAIVLRDPKSQETRLETNQKDVPVGAIGLRIGEDSDLAIGSDQAELGFWIAKPLWGEGLMPEAVREVMRYAFCDLKLAAIWAGSTDDNERSRRVMEKTGFTYQRSIRNRPRKVVGDYKTEDVNWITRDEWEILLNADPTDADAVRAQQVEADDIVATIPRIAMVRSGGQTGADRGALDAAREAGVPICGWCPPGGLAEDLPEAPGLLARYPELKEGVSEGYVERTAWNVRDSHATLIVAPAGLEPCSGTQMTEYFAQNYGRACLVIRGVAELGEARSWLEGLGYGITLNVAGPRESKTPGTYAITKQVVSLLLA